MSFSMFVTWVLVGVLMGVLAGLVMKPGGYGLKRDITLGLVGAIGGSWLFRAIGLFPEAGIVPRASSPRPPDGSTRRRRAMPAPARGN